MALAPLCRLVDSLYHHSFINGILFRIYRQNRKTDIGQYNVDIPPRAFQITFDCSSFVAYKYNHLSFALLPACYDFIKHEQGQQQTDDSYFRIADVDEFPFKNTCMADTP